MTTVISWPEDTTDVIDSIRNAVGRDITIFTVVSGMPCPVSGCFWDPYTEQATDPFCPTCSGNYWINTLSGYTLNAHVRLGSVDTPIYTIGGFIDDGKMRVQVKFTEATVNAITSADYYEVDDKIYVQEALSFRGVPDINRIIITLIEQEG